MIRLIGYYNKDELDYENLKNLDNIDINKLDWNNVALYSPNELFTPEFVEKYKNNIISSYYILRRSDLDEKYGFLDYILSKFNKGSHFKCISSKIYNLYSYICSDLNSIVVGHNLFKIKNKLIELSKEGLIDEKFSIILEGNKSEVLEYCRTHRLPVGQFSLDELILIKFGNKIVGSVETNEIMYTLAKENVISKFSYIRTTFSDLMLNNFIKLSDDKLENIKNWLEAEPISNLEILNVCFAIELEREGKQPEDFRNNIVKEIMTLIKTCNKEQSDQL